MITSGFLFLVLIDTRLANPVPSCVPYYQLGAHHVLFQMPASYSQFLMCLESRSCYKAAAAGSVGCRSAHTRAHSSSLHLSLFSQLSIGLNVCVRPAGLLQVAGTREGGRDEILCIFSCAEGESRVLNQGQGSNIRREVTCKLLRL